jgi:leader peptidase (prepilin peptidase) / N-methyltransferase
MSESLGATSAPSAGVAASKLTLWAAVAAGGLGVLAALIRFGASSDGLVAAVLLGPLGVLAVIDFREHVVPHRLVLPAAALVLGLQLALFPDQAVEWILAALITWAVLLGLSMLKRDSLDAGDAQLGLLLGAGLGLDVAWAMLLGVMILWPVAAYLVFSEGVDARKKALPLTPALALGDRGVERLARRAGLAEQTDCGRPVGRPELRDDARDVPANCDRRDKQPLRDLSRSLTLGQQVEHLPFAARQLHAAAADQRQPPGTPLPELVDQPGHQRAGYRGFAGDHPTQRLGEAVGVRVLQEIAGRACAERVKEVAVVARHREHHHRAVRECRADLGGGANALAGHMDVE